MPQFLPDFLLLAAGMLGTPLLAKRLGPHWGKSWVWAVQTFGWMTFTGGLVVTVGLYLHQGWAFRGPWPWVSGLALVLAIVAMVALVLSYLASHLLEPRFSAGRRQAAARLLQGAALAAPATVATFGIVSKRRDYRLVEQDIVLPGLPASANGLRIVQLSDIHLSPYLSRADLAYCVDMANEARADIAVVTGDLITRVGDSIDDCIAELKRLKSTAGIYGCMGNHERYAEAENYTAEHGRLHGLNFLRQQAEVLQFGEAKIVLAGVDYQPIGSDYLREAARLKAPGSTNILLSHNPDVFPVAAGQGWDLTLAGHTHGGQVTVEILDQNINPVRAFVTPFVYGRYRQGKSSLFVTRGIGTIGVPARLGAPPEVAVIRLRAG